MPTTFSPRTAGNLAIASVVLFVAALVALALFFGGVGDFWGPINDVTIAVSLLLVIPVIWAVDGFTWPTVGIWLTVIGWAAVLGILLAAGGQLMLVIGVVPLETTFATFGIGALPYLAWILALSWVALQADVLPRGIGWWGVGFLAVAAVSLLIAPLLPVSSATLTVLLGGPLTVAYSGWLLGLAGFLRAS
ncbi:MAG TPA: hypothetical protein VK838_02870 [Candidatus Limnocylindrales bacterium]|nr:hypothetical protein [Candidatus Limnocylindrales bacterium]